MVRTMDTFTEQLLREIEEFQESTELSDTSFGLAFNNDGKFIKKLRTGQKTTTLTTADKLREFMAEFNQPKCAA